MSPNLNSADANASDNSSKENMMLYTLASGASDFNLSSASPNNPIGNDNFGKSLPPKTIISDTTDSNPPNIVTESVESNDNLVNSTSNTSADQNNPEITESNNHPLKRSRSSLTHSTQSLPTDGLTDAHDHEDNEHDPNKKYHCSSCGKTFTRKHNLVSHELIHSQIKPHICSVCSSSFRRIHDLKRHEKLHTGEKPFKCEFCPKRFARPDSLVRHQNSQNACPGLSKSLKLSGNNAAAVESSGGTGTSIGVSESTKVAPSLQKSVPSIASGSSKMPLHLNPTELPPIRKYPDGIVSSTVSQQPSELPSDILKQFYPTSGETINQQSEYQNGKYIRTTTITTTHVNKVGFNKSEDKAKHDREHDNVINSFSTQQRNKTYQDLGYNNDILRDTQSYLNNGGKSTNFSGESLELSGSGYSNGSDLKESDKPESVLGSGLSSGPRRPNATPSLHSVDGNASETKASQQNQSNDANILTGESSKMNLEYDSPSGSSGNEVREEQPKVDLNIADDNEPPVPGQGRRSFQGDKQFMYNQLRDSSIYQYPNKEYISLSRYQDLVAYTQSLEESLNRINSRIQLLEDESADHKIERERAKQVSDSSKHRRVKRHRDNEH